MSCGLSINMEQLDMYLSEEEADRRAANAFSVGFTTGLVVGVVVTFLVCLLIGVYL